MDQWARLNMVPNKEFDIDFKFENTGDISAKIKMNGKFTLSKLAELSSLIPELIEVSLYYLLDCNVASTLYSMAILVMEYVDLLPKTFLSLENSITCIALPYYISP